MTLHKKITPDLLCCGCGYKLDSHRNADNGTEAPKNGDYTICFQCGEVLRFVITGNFITGYCFSTVVATVAEIFKELSEDDFNTMRSASTSIKMRNARLKHRAQQKESDI